VGKNGLFHRWIADNQNPSSLASRMRRKRFALLLRQLSSLPRPSRVLDVGGSVEFWRAMDGLRLGFSVTVLNLKVAPQTPPDGFEVVEGDARDLSRFDDRSFSLVFSNSVIEHVGGFDDQRRMAAECRRVGVRYFVQTPNVYFPIEPHFLLPWFQFYPRSAQIGLTRRFALGWYPRIPDRDEAAAHVASHRLLKRSEMVELFPDGQVLEERVAGLTKSFIASGPGWGQR